MLFKVTMASLMVLLLNAAQAVDTDTDNESNGPTGGRTSTEASESESSSGDEGESTPLFLSSNDLQRQIYLRLKEEARRKRADRRIKDDEDVRRHQKTHAELDEKINMLQKTATLRDNAAKALEQRKNDERVIKEAIISLVFNNYYSKTLNREFGNKVVNYHGEIGALEAELEELNNQQETVQNCSYAELVKKIAEIQGEIRNRQHKLQNEDQIKADVESKWANHLQDEYEAITKQYESNPLGLGIHLLKDEDRKKLTPSQQQIVREVEEEVKAQSAARALERKAKKEEDARIEREKEIARREAGRKYARRYA